MPESAARFAGIALLAGIALGTTAGEIATGVAVAAVLSDRDLRRAAWAAPVTGWIGVLAVAWIGLGLRADGFPLASLGRIWSLAPLVCAAVLPMPERVGVRLALPAAAWCVAGAVVARATGDPSEDAGSGPWDHHLSAAYALIGPAIAAFWLGMRREGAVLAAGVVATGSLGGLAGLGAGLLTAVLGWPAAIGSALLALVAPLAVPGLVADRAILWTAGAQLAGVGGVPPGGWRAAVTPVHLAWDPAFEFPHHAHDTALQLAGDAGPAGWLALGLAGAGLWRARAAWALPLAAALAVGATSQDWFGDLEAVRAAGVWLVLAARQREAADVVDVDGAGPGPTPAAA